MRELYLIATNEDIPLELRYDAARLMKHKRGRKIPLWKERILQAIMRRNKRHANL